MDIQAILDAGRQAVAARREAERIDLDALLRRARGGDVAAMYSAAHDLDVGVGGERDVAGAIRWYERAAAAGEYRAMHNLGCLHDELDEPAEARTWYLRAATHGDAAAMCNLGFQSEHGIGATRSVEEAVAWYRRAVELDDAQSRVNLASILREQDPVQNAYAVAELLRDAAEEGRAAGILGWAECLWEGYGVEADPRAAERWMCRIASQGHEAAIEWLRRHARSWIDVWPWTPGRSFGPLRLGKSIEPLVERLELVAEDDLDSGPEESALSSRLYGLYLLLTRNRLTSVTAFAGTAVRVLYRDQDLIGLDVEAALHLLDAEDFVVDDSPVTDDYWIESEALGATLHVTDETVRGFSAALDADDPLWES